MKYQNFIVEMILDESAEPTFIVRAVSPQPNVQPQVVNVSHNCSHLSAFFSTLIKRSKEESNVPS